MNTPRLGRREFLLKAGLAAGTMGVTTGAASLVGCGGGSSPGPVPPGAPTDLVATAVSAARIDLAWADHATDETSYEIERRLATETIFTPLATIASDQVSYSDEAVVERTMYVYRVRAVAEGLDSDYSNEADATTPATGAPLAPANVAVESVMADGAVITWSDEAINESGYRLDRVDNVSVVPILTLPAGATRAELTGLSRDDLVRVLVVAFNELGESPPSAEARFFTGAAAGDILFLVPEPNVLRVMWTDRSAGRVGFILERDLGSGFEVLATLPVGTTTADDAGLSPGVTPTYRIRAADVFSIDSPTAAPDASMLRPARPTGLTTGLLDSNGSRVVVEWQHPGPVDGFILERRVGTGAFTTISNTADPSLRRLEDNPQAVLVDVTYLVTARNAAGTSQSANEATIQPRAVFFFAASAALMTLKTVNKGVPVTVSRPSVSLGASCQASSTSIYLVRESESSIAAVVAHCTHECLRP
ncbi:MAG TPA: fibronectin type III domain-containing protein, partial [Candidatus Eisenbacteria bacterium]